ncbi:hypothetical protein ACQ5SK_09800 [Bradyrhizobium japonicum]
MRFKTADLARARLADIEPDPVDLAATYEVGRDTLKRFLFALDDKTILSQVERSGQILDEDQKKLLIEYARRELRQDPIAWERPVGDNAVSGQLSMMRSGVNLETALLICDITGAFPYTNMRSRWRELVAARDELSETARVWSPLANTFQSLEFKFLSNVDVGFATSIREDGRLESFRSLLRTIGKQASEISSLTALDSFVRNSKDALIGEHKKATAEWDKIRRVVRQMGWYRPNCRNNRVDDGAYGSRYGSLIWSSPQHDKSIGVASHAESQLPQVQPDVCVHRPVRKRIARHHNLLSLPRRLRPVGKKDFDAGAHIEGKNRDNANR